jgi:hypothetical protein
MSPPPSHATSPQDERSRALRELWQAKGRNTNKKADVMEKNLHSSDATQFWGAPEQERLSTADVIVIEPQVQQESPEYFSCQSKLPPRASTPLPKACRNNQSVSTSQQQ